MSSPNIAVGEAVRITNTGNVQCPDSGYLQGLIVNASSSGTLTLKDSGGNRTLLNALPLTAGQSLDLYGMRFNGVLAATVGGTADVTLVYA